jgi:hypothetical protein
LFAALEVATEKIIAPHSKRRRGVEFLGVMNSVVAAFPDNELDVILDNLNTHTREERTLAQETRAFHSDTVVLAQLARNSVFDPAAPLTQRSNCRSTSMLSSRPTTRQPSHSLGRPAAVQESPYHSALIPGGSVKGFFNGEWGVV